MKGIQERINQLSPDKRQALLSKITEKSGKGHLMSRIPLIPRDRLPSAYPLSYSQQRLWFLYEWEPESPSYHIPCLFKLSFRVDVSILEQSVQALVARHEILRTTYRTTGDDTVQVVHPFSPIPMEILDFSGAVEDEEGRRLRLDAAIRERSLIPFQLNHEFPIRAYLFKWNSEDYSLLLNIHHIACDGWSIGILMSDIQQSYMALLQNQPLEPVPPRLQYADFASWQRSYLTGDVLGTLQEYWRNQLHGDLPILELPGDKPRPPVKTFQGAAAYKAFPEGLITRLQRICKEEEATLYMVLLSAYFTLLHRYTGQRELIVGSPIANRNRAEVEQTVGFFVNTLPIRIQVDELATFRSLLRQVKEVSLEAYAHQDLPLDKMIETVQLERDLSHTPLFQVLFVLQNMHVGYYDSEEVHLEFDTSIKTNSSKFDMTFSATEEGIEAEYSTDLFQESTVLAMLGHYCNLLERIGGDPDQILAGIDLLSAAEQQLMLQDWNRTHLVHDDSFHVVRCIEDWAARTPDQTALVYEGAVHTYRDLNRRANGIAQYLVTQGIGPEKVVGIFLERSAEFVVAMLAVLKAGGAYVPLDPSYPQDRLQYMIRESGMHILITHSKLTEGLQLDNVSLLNLGMNWDRDMLHYSDQNPAVRTEAGHLMYMIFTSGTTGTPKGVCVELRHFHNYMQGILRQLDVQEPLSYAMASTFAADLGMTNVFGALCTGGTLHVLSYDRSCDPDGVADYFRNHPIDMMKVVPSHMEAMLTAAEPRDVIPRRTLILAGEGLSWETAARIRSLRPECRLENHYGPTETTVSALAYPIPRGPEPQPHGLVPIGRPIGNVRTYVLDPHGKPVPAGVPGELYIGGDGVTRGYLNNPELTQSRFLQNPFDEERGLLYRTGDRVRYLRDGTVQVLGRMDRQIKIRGFRIELGEIESVMTSIPCVRDAVVLLKEIGKSEKRILAFTVFEPNDPLEVSLAELKRGLKEKLPEYMMPNHIIGLEALPLNPNGKVDMNLLLSYDLLQRAEGAAASEPPQTELEQRIWEIWQEVLETSEFGIDDGFFELGGESFKALKVVRKLGSGIGIMDFFKHPTIRTLARYIDQGETAERRLLHQLTRQGAGGGARTSLVCVPYAGGSAITYQPLAAQLPPHVDLYAVEIPAHDYSRRSEALLPVREVARLCVEEIKNTIRGPVALYGHCVGGALTIEIARQLERENIPLKNIFLGGTFPIARIPGRLFNLYAKLFPSDRVMSNKSYHEFLKALGGFTEVENNEERDFMIRNLRHDARESEDYYTEAYAEANWAKLRAPITCIIGERDRATELYEERYKEWSYFSHEVNLVVVPEAGHYFIKHQADHLSRTICGTIQSSEAARTAPAVPASAFEPPVKAGVSLRLMPNLRTFFIVILGQLMSILGSGLTGIAIGVWVFSQTGSVSDFAAISSASLIPGILVLPIAGAIVDRYDRRLVMLYSDLLMGLSIAVLAVLMAAGLLEIWHIYVTSAVGSISRSFHRPAFMASIAQIIPKPYLGHANGIVQLASSTSEMLAPLLGVSLYTLIGMTNIFILDFVSFLIAIVTLLLVRFPNALFHKREESFLKEVLMGWKFIIRRPGLLYMIGFFFIGNILFGLATVLIQPLVLSQGSASLLALVTVLGAVGAMAAGLLMSLWGGTKRRASGMVGFVILEGFFMVCTGIRPEFIFPAVGIFGIWFAVTLVNSHWQSLIQTKVGLALQGRVLATNQMIAMSSMPIGYLLAGLLADSVFAAALEPGGFLAGTFGPVIGIGAGRGIALLLVFVGILVMLWSLLGFNFRPLRYMEDDLEDAIPDAVIADRDTLQELLDERAAQRKYTVGQGFEA